MFLKCRPILEVSYANIKIGNADVNFIVRLHTHIVSSLCFAKNYQVGSEIIFATCNSFTLDKCSDKTCCEFLVEGFCRTVDK